MQSIGEILKEMAFALLRLINSVPSIKGNLAKFSKITQSLCSDITADFKESNPKYILGKATVTCTPAFIPAQFMRTRHKQTTLMFPTYPPLGPVTHPQWSLVKGLLFTVCSCKKNGDVSLCILLQQSRLIKSQKQNAKKKQRKFTYLLIWWLNYREMNHVE